MDQHVALDAALITSMPERKGEVRVLAWCSFVIATAMGSPSSYPTAP
jgi:hypothetical protein